MDSLVLKYMINEFSQNYDGNLSSEFFYKPADSESTVAFAGPVWDMDNTYAAYARDYNEEQIMSPKGLFIAGASRSRYWWPNLYRHEDFRQRVRELWPRFAAAVRILLGQTEVHETALRSLAAYEAEIAESAEMNFARYPMLKGNWSQAKTGASPEENWSFLREFIEKRAEYLETAWLQGGE